MGVSIAISSSLITLSFLNFGLNSDFSSVEKTFNVEQSKAFLEGFKTAYYVLMSISVIAIILAIFTRIHKDNN